MSEIESFVGQWELNRIRTLATLDDIAKLESPSQTLGWRPAPGRAHIAWQLMHIAITEELFATERLVNTAATLGDLIGRFKGGSTPDENIPSVDFIRETLQKSRDRLIATVQSFTSSDLERIPEALAQRGWTIRRALQVVSWHEAHHQGQAHITLNLYKNRQSA